MENVFMNEILKKKIPWLQTKQFAVDFVVGCLIVRDLFVARKENCCLQRRDCRMSAKGHHRNCDCPLPTAAAMVVVARRFESVRIGTKQSTPAQF